MLAFSSVGSLHKQLGELEELIERCKRASRDGFFSGDYFWLLPTYNYVRPNYENIIKELTQARDERVAQLEKLLAERKVSS